MEEGFRFKSSYWLLALPAIAFSGGGLLVAGCWLLVKRVKVQGSSFMVYRSSFMVTRIRFLVSCLYAFMPSHLHTFTP